jgi:molybdopterin-guanine dinucleotide biosynthesis protein A
VAITAVVLAGGGPDRLSALQDVPNKAFVQIGGIALVERTIDALRSSTQIGRIISVAPPETHDRAELHGSDERRPAGARISESLLAGLASLPLQELVLVSASDLPFLSTAGIEDFIAQARARDCDLAYACVGRRDHLAHFPDVPHTWARLREGSFCGAGFIAIKPRVLPSLLLFLERLGAARKNPLQLAGIFGWDIFIRFGLGRLAIGAAEERASRLLGAPVGAIVSRYPEIAINIDRASDVALAERLAERWSRA